MQNTILRIEKITKNFGGLVALNNVDLEVHASEIFGIIGPNGSGKSTLLNVISGFFQPTGGKFFFDGHDTTGLKADQMAQRGIGRNFQTSTLFMDLSVTDNVYTGFHKSYATNFWARLLRLPSALKEEDRLIQKAMEIIEFMGLSSLKNELAKNLPHGYQRILGVCIALATGPKLLLLDEPLTGMNRNEIQTMTDLIRRIRESGITIIIIEHNVEAIMNLCDRIAVLSQGCKIAEGLPREIQTNPEVIEAYLGKE